MKKEETVEMSPVQLERFGRTRFTNFMEFLASQPKKVLPAGTKRLSVGEMIKTDFDRLQKAKLTFNECVKNQEALAAVKVKKEGELWEMKNKIQRSTDDKNTLLKIIAAKGLPSDSPAEQSRLGEVNILLESLGYQLLEKENELSAAKREISHENMQLLRENVLRAEKEFFRSVLLELRDFFLSSDLLKWIWAASLTGHARGRLDSVFKHLFYNINEPSNALLEPTLSEIEKHYSERFKKEAE